MCFCSCSCSSSLWRCCVPFAGPIMVLPRREQPRCARDSTVCSSPAAQTIALPVILPPLPRRGEIRRFCLCVPGVRSKAAEELCWLLGTSVHKIGGLCLHTRTVSTQITLTKRCTGQENSRTGSRTLSEYSCRYPRQLSRERYETFSLLIEEKRGG